MPKSPIFDHKLRLKGRQAGTPVGAAGGYAPTPVAGHEYYPTWGTGVSSSSLLVGNIGLCILSPIELDTTRTYDRLRARVNNASSSVHRLGIYYLSRTTWLPTALALDAGTVSWTGAGGDRTKTISFNPSQALCALGMLYESRSDAVNPSVPTLTAPAGGAWPPGYDAASAALTTVANYGIASGGNAAGAMPAASTFSPFVTSAATLVQYLIGIRVV